MMTDAVIGKTKAEALELAEIFSLMIQGEHDINTDKSIPRQ